ncbi:hypothetical protein CEXT_94371 [Caerostris extrusa]|uniref:Uncharacterized protein n=1 Tax=Caerostris extrusa TaxID=172846 RepID=A0AAV4Y008_CAEEX|nr:hypothetical protein CEXT_94371 [Caerostris extrusa]
MLFYSIQTKTVYDDAQLNTVFPCQSPKRQDIQVHCSKATQGNFANRCTDIYRSNMLRWRESCGGRTWCENSRKRCTTFLPGI